MHPRRFRWRALFGNVETAGIHAPAIVALLAFMMGVVIAYQGGRQLEFYGANIFIVELVSLTMLRELAPLITAIIVAGRTGSSFTPPRSVPCRSPRKWTRCAPSASRP